jgi:acetylornithine deacetylase
MGSTAEEAALRALEPERCVALAQAMVQVPSVTGDEGDVQDVVVAALDEAGLEVDHFEADLAEVVAHPRFPGMEAPRDRAVLVAGTLGPANGRSLILNGHVDVVPPGDPNAWDESPWSGHISDGHLYGRGSCDMKSAVAVAISAARAIKKSGLYLDGRLIVESVASEEDGGLGTFAMGLRGYKADAAYVLEPTKLQLIPAQAGALSFRLRIVGMSAHAAVRYEGVSVIEKFEPVRARLAELERSLNRDIHPLFGNYPIPYPLSIGTMRAGEWSASVPDKLECEGRVGVPIGIASDAVRGMLAEALHEVEAQDPWLAEHPIELTWFGGQFEAVEVDVEQHPAFSALRDSHAAEFDQPPGLSGAPYGSDMRLLVQEADTPAILYGPGDIRRAHKGNECIQVDDIVHAARVVTAAAARYLTGETS